MVFFALSQDNFFGCLFAFVGVSVGAISFLAIKLVNECFVRFVGEVFSVVALKKLDAFAKQRRAIKL